MASATASVTMAAITENDRITAKSTSPPANAASRAIDSRSDSFCSRSAVALNSASLDWYTSRGDIIVNKGLKLINFNLTFPPLSLPLHPLKITNQTARLQDRKTAGPKDLQTYV
jgi:hypothetical protein